MTQETTRSGQNNISGSTLFLAFELGTSEWKLAFSIGLGRKPRKRRRDAGSRGRLAAEVAAAKVALGAEERLDGMRLWDGSGLRPGLKSRLKREWEQVLFLKRQIAVLQAERRCALRKSEEPDMEKIRQLSMLRGIGENGSWVFVREFFGWRKFHNRREVGSLAGLTPTPYQSGRTMREQGVSKAGNRHVRGGAIELAWCWVRWQPESKLTRWFEARFAKAGSRGRKVGIVAVARRLLIDLWRYLETGVLPEGAQLKAEV